MNIIQKLALRLLTSGDSKMRAYEHAAFRRIRNELCDDAKSVLDYQLSKMNLVQRLSNEKEVNLYSMAGPKKPIKLDLLFADQGEERLLATLTIESASDRKFKITATVWLVRGQIFSLIFDKPPLKLMDDKYIVSSCCLHIDPMRPNSLEHMAIPGTTPIIDRLNEIYPVSEITPPLSEKILKNGRSLDSLKLPLEFRELLCEASSCRIGHWRILGAEAREVQIDETELLIIAENSGSANLCVIQNCDEPILTTYNYSTQESHQLGQSFIDAIRKLNPAHDD